MKKAMGAILFTVLGMLTAVCLILVSLYQI